MSLVAATRAKIAPNQWSITIEHESDTGANLTPAQWEATYALQAWLCREFRITPDGVHLIGHNLIDAIDRPYCPGWTEAQWAKLRTEIARRLGGAPASAPVAPASRARCSPTAVPCSARSTSVARRCASRR